ncbi:MAG: MetQ/NlpA family ABC transporter substrate-binding protein [Chloroflexi bacterium]|nr:MetQ/NlpA family ABC transporter substrate-binding protein [Chloroflexota bacterium]
MNFRRLFLINLLLLSLFGMPLLAQEEMAEPDLRFAILDVLNTLPVIVAQEAGYFEEAGITVELTQSRRSVEIQAAAVAGELDGFQSDLVSALKVNANGGDVQLVRHVGITNSAFFGIVAGPGSGLESAADLAGSRIAISHNTIVEYTTDTLLAGAGVDVAEVEYVEIASILERMQELLEGSVPAATLPQPLLQIARQFGARDLLDDSVLDYVPEAVSFRTETMANKGEAVRAFLNAYERAVAELNAMRGDTSAYQRFVEEIEMDAGTEAQALVSSGIITVPTFAGARVPSAADYAIVHDWALEKGVLQEAQAYEDVVAAQFLPEEIADDTVYESEDVAATGTQEAMPEPDLRVLVAPSVTSLPIHIALGAGYFEEAGIRVELRETMDVLEIGGTQSAVINREVDGSLMDLVTQLKINAAGGDLRIVRHVGTEDFTNIAILVGPAGSALESVEDLVGSRIGVAHETIFHYLTDAMLASAGISAEEVEYVEIPRALEQYEQLLQGQVPTILTVEPVIQLALRFGARILLDAAVLDYVPEAVFFREETLAEKGEAVRAFMSALERAVTELNAIEGDLAAYQEFIESALVRQSGSIIMGYFATGLFPTLPTFTVASVPSESDFASVHDWALEKGILQEAQAYEVVVDGSFLPEMMDDASDE